MASATVRRWLKNPGDAVRAGELIVEIEGDAGLIQVESPVSGRLGEILLRAGQTGSADAPLAVIEAPKLEPTPSDAPRAAVKNTVAPAGRVIPILMPKAGQSMEEGIVTKWLVQPGAVVTKGQVIFEIETDKAVMEVDSPESGRLARIVVAEGGVSPVQVPVAYLADTDAEVDVFIASSGERSTPDSTGTSERAAAVDETDALAAPFDRKTTAPTDTQGGRGKASPAARKIARERGVDLDGILQGSGPGGRILSTDLPIAATASASRRRLTGMRKAIAKSLVQSKQSIPHFYVRLTIDAGPLLTFYKIQKEKFPCSINDVIVMACARLLKDFPAFRSRVEGDEIVESPSADIGIAVGMDEGLVVPVLQGADGMDLARIAAETKRLAGLARGGKSAAMGSGSFTITNLGMFGTEEFAAIINPPEAAILAVGAAREAVIVKDGALRPGKQMTMTLSADHRVIDGMLAARFLARLKELLEAPETIR